MFIENNFINSKEIFIDIVNKKIHIVFCDVNIFIYFKIFKKIFHKKVHVFKFINVFSMSKIIIVVYNNVIISLNKNFLFKLNEFNVLIYIHIMNLKTREILIQNECYESRWAIKALDIRGQVIK